MKTERKERRKRHGKWRGSTAQGGGSTDLGGEETEREDTALGGEEVRGIALVEEGRGHCLGQGRGFSEL